MKEVAKQIIKNISKVKEVSNLKNAPKLESLADKKLVKPWTTTEEFLKSD